MAVVTRRMAFETPDFLAHIYLTFDDANLIVIDEWTDDISECDLVSVRLNVVRGTAVIEVQRGRSRVWQEREANEGTDETFSAGGPVRTVGDLDRYHVRGTR